MNRIRAPRLARLAIAFGIALCGLLSFTPTFAQTIETIAGTLDISGRDALSISIAPWNIAAAPDGTVIVADNHHSQILRFDPVAQTFSIVAGSGIRGTGGDGGPAVAAELSSPAGVAFDSVGNLFIADPGNGTIRKIAAATGVITTVAGGGWNSGDGVPAVQAMLQGPWSVAVGPDDSIYIVEQDAHRIRRVAPGTELITTVAGTGVWGNSGDGGPAQYAKLARPSDVTFDAAGNLYIADQFNHAIRRVDAVSGIITRYAGTGVEGWDLSYGMPAVDTGISMPTSLRFDAQGNLLFTEQGTGHLRRVRAMDGTIDFYPFSIAMPQGLAVAGNGDLYLTSSNNYTLHRLSMTTGQLVVVAGNGSTHQSGDDHPAILAQLSPDDLIVDEQNRVSLIDGFRIRQVNGIGAISTIAGAGEWGVPGEGGPALNAFISYATALTSDAQGNLFVAEQGNLRIRKISATGAINHYAGIGYGYGGDGGPAISATMRTVRDMATDAAGNLYIVEEGSYRVRRVDAATGIITTFAGTGLSTGPLNDVGPATLATLRAPQAITIDHAGNIFLLDYARIRRIDAITGVITTIAGNDTYSETGDGGLAINATLMVGDLVVDRAGNLFTTNVFTNRVRKIDAATGVISTIAGTGVNSSTGDGGPAVQATLNEPRALAMSESGDLYIAEAYRIRRIAGVTPPFVDTTPPVISYSVNGPQGNNGWYVGDVTVTWTVTDAESAIHASVLCDTTTITNDTAGLTLMCHAVSEGGPSSGSVTIKRDATPPTALIHFPENGAAYALGSQIASMYGCPDEMSGVGSCVGPVPATSPFDTSSVGTETFAVAMSDQAGNVATSSVTYTVTMPDSTPPVVTRTISGTQGNAQGWYITNATVTWNVSDLESTISYSTGCGPTTINTDTSGVTLTCSAISGGGITNQSITIKRDTVGPVATWGTPSPAPNAAGWNNTNVVIPFTKSDSLSGVTSGGQSSVTVTAQSASSSVSLSLSDIAGNLSALLSPAVKIDKAKPTASITIPANGATYVLGTTLLASYACNDSLSGVNTCTGTVAAATAIDTSTVGTKSFTVTATDHAGNLLTKTVTYTVTTVPAPPPSYCDSRGINPGSEWIQSVQIGSFGKGSGNDGGYGNYTIGMDWLSQGTTSIVLVPGFSSANFSENWRIWIDLNRDGTFGSNERLFNGTATGSLATLMTIPRGTSGATRMRVSMSRGVSPNACGNFSFGEVEDYTVFIP